MPNPVYPDLWERLMERADKTGRRFAIIYEPRTVWHWWVELGDDSHSGPTFEAAALAALAVK